MNTTNNTGTKAFMGTFTFRIGEFERKLNAMFIVSEQSTEPPEMVFEQLLKDEFGYTSDDLDGSFCCDGDAPYQVEHLDPTPQDMHAYLRNIGLYGKAFYCDGDALCRVERIDPLPQDMHAYLRNIGFSQLN